MASSHYVGKAGQLAVMAQLAWRGYNVSIPEIDVGDDIFALNDSNGKLFRIQVKTATGKKLKRFDRAYWCQFSLRRSHVKSAKSGTHYVLAGRCGGNWRFLVFKRYVLWRLIKKGLGTKIQGGGHMIRCVFFTRTNASVSTRSGAQNLSTHAGRWSLWPSLPGGAGSE